MNAAKATETSIHINGIIAPICDGIFVNNFCADVDHPPDSSERGNMRLKGYPMSIKEKRGGTNDVGELYKMFALTGGPPVYKHGPPGSSKDPDEVKRSIPPSHCCYTGLCFGSSLTRK